MLSGIRFPGIDHVNAKDEPASSELNLTPMPSPERIKALWFDAARIGRTDMFPALLYGGADIKATDEKGYTALILASYNGHQEATVSLLELGAPIDQPDEVRGNTALMGVAFKGYGAIAEMLLAAGANPHSVNHAGQSALMMASLFSHYTIVDALLALGADPHAQDVAGNSAISVAHDQGNALMVAHLTDRPGMPGS